jgi:hypothetical protein
MQHDIPILHHESCITIVIIIKIVIRILTVNICEYNCYEHYHPYIILIIVNFVLMIIVITMIIIKLSLLLQKLS